MDGVTTTYHYNNGLLLSQTTGDETLHFYYDSTGKVVSIGYQKGSAAEVGYFFTRNAQGDIIGVYRSSDSKCIGTYEYDLWGRPISVTEATAGIDTDNILTKNPFRYRGYYFDEETGFYYLQSRYYDSAIRRFISADGYMSTGQGLDGHNMFVYCGNNPIVRKDPTGEFWIEAMLLVVMAIGLGGCGLPEETSGTESVLAVVSNPAYGAAGPYVASDSIDFNCYAYALGETEWKYVGGVSKDYKGLSVEEVGNIVLSDAQVDGRGMRPLDAYDSPIESYEYRIAMRMGPDGDYHFAVQHNDGSWSHKPGNGKTRLLEGTNPDDASWDKPKVYIELSLILGYPIEVGVYENYYDSDTIYFAVTEE